jgi:hypothetical protein
VLQLLVTANVTSSLILSTLTSEAIRSSVTSVLTTVTRSHIPEDGILQNVWVLTDHNSRGAEDMNCLVGSNAGFLDSDPT